MCPKDIFVFASLVKELQVCNSISNILNICFEDKSQVILNQSKHFSDWETPTEYLS